MGCPGVQPKMRAKEVGENNTIVKVEGAGQGYRSCLPGRAEDLG